MIVGMRSRDVRNFLEVGSGVCREGLRIDPETVRRDKPKADRLPGPAPRSRLRHAFGDGVPAAGKSEPICRLLAGVWDQLSPTTLARNARAETKGFCSLACKRRRIAQSSGSGKECRASFLEAAQPDLGRLLEFPPEKLLLPALLRALASVGRTTIQGEGTAGGTCAAKRCAERPFCGPLRHDAPAAGASHHSVPPHAGQRAQDNLVPLCAKHHKVVETIFVDIERDVSLAEAKIVLGSQLREASRPLPRSFLLGMTREGRVAGGQVERWPIDRLIPYAQNSRTHTGWADCQSRRQQ